MIEDNSENIYGCTEETAINYDPLANINNGSCIFEDSLCDNTPTELFVNNIIHNRVQFNWTQPEDIPSYYMIRYRPYESNSWTVITAEHKILIHIMGHLGLGTLCNQTQTMNGK